MITKIPLSIHSVKVISPMFSYGNNRLEPRPTELKGLLRNTYRIANPNLDAKTLYQSEVKYFGGQLKMNKEIVMKASPLQVQMFENALIQRQSNINRINKCEYLLFHKNSVKMPCYPFETIFNINLSILYVKDKKLIQWYEDLFHLALIIGGIGKRSRRGRGCMTTDDFPKISNNDLPKKVAELLNNICGSTVYCTNAGKVILVSSKGNDNSRPYIKEIRFGCKLKDMTEKSVNTYLEKVDQASHYIKRTFREPYTTGCGNPRFASSVIVSLAEIKDGIVPIYTFLNAVCKNKTFKNTEAEQSAFVDNIEEGRKQ